jgi:murein L,D-transpeptidase YafK
MKKLRWIILLLLFAFAGWYFYPAKSLPQESVIDKLIVYKSKRQMMAYQNGRLLKVYTIALGKNPVGDKRYEGDCRTPEGKYTINDRNPNSGYHKNLGISYPDAIDKANAKKLGKPVGGNIKIHGLRNGVAGYLSKLHRFTDWTNGCIAVTNEEVDELYKVVKPGAVSEINP